MSNGDINMKKNSNPLLLRLHALTTEFENSIPSRSLPLPGTGYSSVPWVRIPRI
ncbi:hypothetical protein BGX38DRAFT_1192584 [Terfezia claveryi]|nr:hypothetical protein BGX38DRAFT_1192584 [Terfezia claveryi]